MANVPGNEVMGLRGLGAFEELIIVRVACRCNAYCRFGGKPLYLAGNGKVDDSLRQAAAGQ